MEMKFPLPKDAFHAIDVTPKQQQAYLDQVHRLVEESLAEYDRFEMHGSALYKQPWKTTAKTSEMRVVRMKDALLPMRAHYRVFGRSEGDYRQMIEFMYAETTKDFLEWQQIMFPSVVDANVLTSFKSATPEHPHQCMGIRWLACQPVPWERIYTSYVEFISYMKDSKGAAIGVRVNIPVDVPQLAVLMDAMKVKRFDHTVVQILSPSRTHPGVTNIFNVIQHDHPSYVPFVFDRSLLQMAQNMAAFATSRRIVRAKMPTPAEWTPDTARRGCAICRRAFSKLRGRHHCRLCGEVICRNCVIRQDAPQYTAGSEASFRLRKTKFCVLCITRLRDSPPDMLGAATATETTRTRATSQSSLSGRDASGTETDEIDLVNGSDEFSFDDAPASDSEITAVRRVVPPGEIPVHRALSQSSSQRSWPRREPAGTPSFSPALQGAARELLRKQTQLVGREPRQQHPRRYVDASEIEPWDLNTSKSSKSSGSQSLSQSPQSSRSARSVHSARSNRMQYVLESDLLAMEELDRRIAEQARMLRQLGMSSGLGHSHTN